MFTSVRDVMHKNVISVSPEDTIALAAQTMLWTGFRHLPVCRDGRVEGIITERDILRHRAEQGPARANADPISTAMSAPAQWVSAEESMAVAADRMAADKVGCLLVLELGKLVGILTTTDVLRAQLTLPPADPAEAEPLAWAARDVMTRSPVTTTPDEHLVNAIARMSMAGVRHLPVVAERDRLVGMLSERDIRLWSIIALDGTPRVRDPRTRVSTAMTTDVITLRPGASPAVMLTAFADWRLGALPVVDDDGRLLGIVSYVDLLNHFAKTAARAAA